MDIKVAGAFFRNDRVVVCGEGCSQVLGRNSYGEYVERKGPFAIIDGHVYEFHNDRQMVRCLLVTRSIDSESLVRGGFAISSEDVITPVNQGPVSKKRLLDILRRVEHDLTTECGAIATDLPMVLPDDKSWVIDHAPLLQELQDLIEDLELNLTGSDDTGTHLS